MEMENIGGTSHSLRHDSTPQLSFPTLDENIETEVCVVGAGITGLTTAYLLLQEGKRVVVIDDGPIGGGETLRTTAHLSNVLDDRYYVLERLHGEKGAQLAAESHTQAIDRIEQICKNEKIECEFKRVPGYLFFTPEENQIAEKEFEAVRKVGIDVERNETITPRLQKGKILTFPNQAQFHPGKYLHGLAHAIDFKHGRIFTNTHAQKVNASDDAVEIVTAAGHTISAQKVVIATNSPITDRVVIPMKSYAYRTYVLGAIIPKESVPEALYRDNLHPYHYVRVWSGEHDDFLIIGGEDHKTGQHTKDDDERFERLEVRARERFPQIKRIVSRRSGQVMEPADYLAFIGPEPEGRKNVYIATGDSGNGLTHGTVAGILLTDMLLGRKNEREKLYDPKRVTLQAGGEFIKENINTFAQYVDYVTPGEVKSVDEIKNGEGAIIRDGIKKKAVYRDENGTLKEMCANCPHLGAIVRRNSVEKTRDCPAHGSRFSCTGTVVDGPSISDLKECE